MTTIKLVCFDLDETLIHQNSWKELSIALGMSAEEEERLYQQYKRGSITYDQWNDAVLTCYKQHPNSTKEGITRILSTYTYREGAREIVSYLLSKGYIVALVSASINILVDSVSKDLGITYAHAHNVFEFDTNNRLSAIHADGDDTHAKVTHLKKFCTSLGIQLNECVCIADGKNDIEMFKQTGHGITFRDSPIKNEAWKVIDSLQDLREIL